MGTKTKAQRLYELQENDVIDMDLIIQSVTSGMTPRSACKEIVGGTFELSAIVLEGLLKSAGSGKRDLCKPRNGIRNTH